MNRIDLRLIEAVVLLDRQFRLIVRLSEVYEPVMKDLEATIDAKATSLAHVLDIFNYVLGLIDHLARYEKIAYSVPRLNHREKQYRALSTALGGVKEARDQMQHINNDIENDNIGPLLGGVCWVSSGRQLMVGMYDIARHRSSPSIVYDVEKDKYLSEFCFTYGDSYYDLAKALAGVRVFNEHILRKVRIEVGGKPYNAENHYAALCLEIRPAAADGNKASEHRK